ncbi:hypothetical protein GCM10029963_47880 [Micromonospora andamanensis]
MTTRRAPGPGSSPEVIRSQRPLGRRWSRTCPDGEWKGQRLVDRLFGGPTGHLRGGRVPEPYVGVPVDHGQPVGERRDHRTVAVHRQAALVAVHVGDAGAEVPDHAALLGTGLLVLGGVEGVQAADGVATDLGPGDDHPTQAALGELAGKRVGEPVGAYALHPGTGEQADGDRIVSGQRPAHCPLGGPGGGDHPAAAGRELHECHPGGPERGLGHPEQLGQDRQTRVTGVDHLDDGGVPGDESRVVGAVRHDPSVPAVGVSGHPRVAQGRLEVPDPHRRHRR